MQKGPIWLRLKIAVRGPRGIKREERRPAESSRIQQNPADDGSQRASFGSAEAAFPPRSLWFLLRGEQVGRLNPDTAADTNTQGEL